MNPFRPCARRYRIPTSVMPGWVTNTWKKIELAAKLPGWSGDKDAARMRWAARHACKRLRRRLAAAQQERDDFQAAAEHLQERLDELEDERDGLRNQRDNLLDASESWKAEAETALQEVTRLRKVLQPFAGVYPWVTENLKGEDWARWERAAVECLGPDALKALEAAALACEEKCCMTGVKC